MPPKATHLLTTPVSQGTYFLDNKPVSAVRLCELAEVLDPGIRHAGLPEQVVIVQRLVDGQPVNNGIVEIKTAAHARPDDSYVSTREAAQVLRRHGHLVTSIPL